MNRKILCLFLVSLLGIPSPPSLANDLETNINRTDAHPLIQTVRYLPWPLYEEARQKALIIVKGTSQVFRFDRPISQAAVSNVEICDIVPLNKQEILVYAKQTGHINLIVWDESYSIATFEIQSTIDIERLRQVLRNIDPRSRIRIIPFEDTFSVYGRAETTLKVKQINDTIAAFDKRAISFIRVREPKQILLEVRFAEVERKANKDYGFDLDLITDRFYRIYSIYGQTGAALRKDSPLFTPETGKGFRPTSLGRPKREGLVDFLPLFAPTSTDTQTAGGTFVSRSAAIQYFLRWLEQKNILKIIARPNLLTKDGEQASFLVGGETPVIVSNSNGVTVNYKEFGTKLTFIPEIIDDSVIRLKTQTEVSETDFTTTVTVSGTTVPTIIKRIHQNVAELRDNETLIIGGMITQRIERVKRGFPILGFIPLLDRFFSKDKFTRTDVELLITVTPHIVKPFVLEEKKVFYDPKEVSEATRVVRPPYPESQADQINRLMIQGEDYLSFEGKEKKTTRKADRELKREKRKKPEEKQRKKKHRVSKLKKSRSQKQTVPLPSRLDYVPPTPSGTTQPTPT